MTDGSAVVTSGANWSRGFSSEGKVEVQQNTLIIEWRMKRDEDYDATLFVGDGFTNYILFMESSWTGVANPGFRIAKSGAFGSGSITAGNPTTAWMEYRATITGTTVTYERGPSLNNITQTMTTTLNSSIENHRVFFYFTNAGMNTVHIDWVRVR